MNLLQPKLLKSLSFPETSVSDLEGLLLVDKEAGITSHDVVSRVRRALRTKRVGHSGTLDPFATGLLVCAVGQVTRLLPYIVGEPKVYSTRIAFGITTDTDDCTGEPIKNGPLPDWSRLDQAIASLTGTIDQLPPSYSAKHVDGKRAYDLARKGIDPGLKPVRVNVYKWDVSARGENWLEATISCGSGTYIRSLARDLGVALGTFAHCASLRRLSSGPLLVEGAISSSSLKDSDKLELLNPVVSLNPDMARVVLDCDQLSDIRMGRRIPITGDDLRSVSYVLLEPNGLVASIAEESVSGYQRLWQPKIVLNRAGVAN